MSHGQGRKKAFWWAFQAQKFDSTYVVYGTAFVYTELYVKVTDQKKIVLTKSIYNENANKIAKIDRILIRSIQKIAQ